MNRKQKKKIERRERTVKARNYASPRKNNMQKEYTLIC